MSTDFGTVTPQEAAILAATLRRVRDKGQPEVIDIHHPERSAGWKPYVHQAFPKIVYHPAKLDPIVENERRSIELRNQRNPNLPQLDTPHKQPLSKRVATQEELDAARKEGWVLKPPFLVGQAELDETESFASDPLASSTADPGAKAEAKAKK